MIRKRIEVTITVDLAMPDDCTPAFVNDAVEYLSVSLEKYYKPLAWDKVGLEKFMEGCTGDPSFGISTKVVEIDPFTSDNAKQDTGQAV